MPRYSDQLVANVIELLLSAADLSISKRETDDPVIVAARELDIEFGSKAWLLGYEMRSRSMRGRCNRKHYLTMLESATKLIQGERP